MDDGEVEDKGWMMIKPKRDIVKPLLVNVGVAFAFSFAGLIYSRLKAKRKKKSSLPPPCQSPSSDRGNNVDAKGRGFRRDDYHAPRISTTSCNVVSDRYEEMHAQKVMAENSTGSLSPSDRHWGDNNDDFILPEFDDLVREFDFVNAGFPREDTENDRPEQEIIQLKNKLKILKERESFLEGQLLEYYGIKEQEKTVKELQNRLKLNNMEAKLFSLKIESLQTDNKRLAAKVAEHAQISAELDIARSKIKLLKKKIRSESEHNKEQIITLQKQVAKLQEDSATDLEIQTKSQKMKDLEIEAEELRDSNTRLQIENSELSQRLESTQILANSMMEDPENEVLKQMGDRLKRDNEGLKKEIEQLQADRCADVEELVYLRWINACLRYELRHHQPPAGKTVARDLSKSLSTESEQKAKQLILEYANPDGTADTGISVMDFDSDRWSSSQNSSSHVTDSENFDDSSFDNSSSAINKSSGSPRKIKLFNKLRKLIRGKDSEVGSSSGHKRSRWSSGESDNSSISRHHVADLMKYAGALMDSRNVTEKPPK